MTVLRDTDGNKIQRNASDEVLVDSGGNSSKTLHIDTDLQQLNRIHKDGSNLVSQITDKANNIAFVADVKSTFSYDGYFQTGVNGEYSANKNIDLGNKDWAIRLRIRIGATGTAYHRILSNRTSAPVNSGFTISLFNTTPSCSFSSNNTFYSAISTTTPTPEGLLFDLILEKQGNVIKMFHTDPTGAVIKHYKSITLANDTIDFNADAVLKLFKDQDLTQRDYEFYHLIIEENISYYFDIAGAEGTTVDDVPNPSFNNSFIFHKRFANKSGNIKGFLSSRYLKDAVINSSDEITTIYDEQGNAYASSGTNVVKITNKGLYFQGSAYLQRAGFEIGTNDFFIGKWVNNSNSNDANIYQNSGITIDKNSGNYRVNGNVIAAFNTNTYEYVWVLRKTNVLYYGVGGLQGGSIADSTNYTLSDTIIGSNIFIGYIDDVLPSIGDSILNPATFVSGSKKFEPPRRRSLDSHILQFPNTIIQL